MVAHENILSIVDLLEEGAQVARVEIEEGTIETLAAGYLPLAPELPVRAGVS